MAEKKEKPPAWFYDKKTGEGKLCEDGECPTGYADKPPKQKTEE